MAGGGCCPFNASSSCARDQSPTAPEWSRIRGPDSASSRSTARSDWSLPDHQFRHGAWPHPPCRNGADDRARRAGWIGFISKRKALAEALRIAGVVVETPPDIQAALWEKLVFIAAVSGVGAVARATIGEVRECVPARQLLQQLMEEAVAVAQAQGIRLREGVITRTLAVVESLPASGTASMQRDFTDGKPSELEEIIGAVVRLGDRSAVATPTMDCVYASLLPQELHARGVIL